MKKVVLFCLVIGQLVACGDDLVVGSEEVAPTAEPGILETGERLATALAAVDAEGLSATQMNQVYLGSYLVNGVSGCSGCHNSDAGHLAGGNEFPVRFLPPGVDGNTSVFVRNLTPDPETGLKLTESEFIESMRTGAHHIPDALANGRSAREDRVHKLASTVALPVPSVDVGDAEVALAAGCGCDSEEAAFDRLNGDVTIFGFDRLSMGVAVRDARRGVHPLSIVTVRQDGNRIGAWR